MLIRPWLADFLKRFAWKRRQRIRLRRGTGVRNRGTRFPIHAEVLECRILLSNPATILGMSTGKVTVEGTVTAPSEIDTYTFSLSHDSEVYFDSLTNSANFTWTLSGPAGTTVSGRQFDHSDAFAGPANPVLNLVSGNYTLTVTASGTTTGDYAFRLLDLAVADSLPIGAPLSGTIVAGDTTNAYQFTAVAGDAYSLTSTATSLAANDDWRLIGPYGNQLAASGLSADLGTLTLGTSGKYTLLVEGSIGSTVDATYTVNATFLGNTPPVVPASTPLVLGATVIGTLATAGQHDLYSFTLASNSLLYFDSLTNDGSLNWSLAGPAGSVVSSRSFAFSDGSGIGFNPVLKLVAGDYILTVAAAGSATGDYSFRLSNLAAATSLTPGTAVNDTLNPGNNTNLYQFQATAGQSVNLADQVTGGSGSSDLWRLVDPYGNIVSSQNLGTDSGRLTLNSTGIYSVLVEGAITSTASVDYTLNVFPVVDVTQPLTLGSTVTETLNTPGQQDTYTFTLAANSLLYFDSLTNDFDLRWTLTGPAGTVVSGRPFSNSDGQSIAGSPVVYVVAGDYTLTVAGFGNDAGPYSFRLSDLAAATSVTPGAATAGTLDSGNNTNLFRFQGTAGQAVYLASQVTSGSGFLDDWRLVDPYGNVGPAQTLGNDIGRITLGNTGTYALLVEGAINNSVPVEYTLNVVPEIDPAPQALTLGAAETGNLTLPGERDTYTFHLDADAPLYFDSLMSDAGFNWSLSGPAGTSVSGRSFGATDVTSTNSGNPNPVVNVVAGDYTLTVAASGGSTGAYGFQVLNLAAAPPLPADTPVSGTLVGGNSTNAYSLTVVAGDSYSFSNIVPTSFANGWRVIDGYGNTLVAASQPTNMLLTFRNAGNVTLLIEGANSNTADANYTIEASFLGNTPPTDPAATPLSFGTTVNATPVTVNSEERYSFHLAAGTLVYFDSLTNDSFYWSLVGPLGTAVSFRPFAHSDGVDGPNSPVMNLAAGDYIVTIVGSSAAAYSFRLLDLGAASTLTPGTPVSDTLVGGNSTNAYRFTATAGQAVYLANQLTSGTGVPNYVRLVDPYGNVVAAQYLGTDLGRVTLSRAGTYTVLVEGAIGNVAASAYTLNVVPIVDATQSLTLGSTVPGNLTTPGEQDTYTFHLVSHTQAYFDALTNNVNFNWSLSGPAGIAVSGRLFTFSDGVDAPGNPVMELPAGDYTLTIAGSGGTTGAYSFRLLDLADATSLTPGTSFSDTLVGGNSTNAYRFTATAGQSFYLANQLTSGTGVPNYWRLVDPYGNFVSTQYVGSDIGRVTLKTAGTYTVIVEGEIANVPASAYTLNAIPVIDPAPLPITLTAAAADEPPAITSDVTAAFIAGIENGFQVIATGSPAPSYTETGALPEGVTFDKATGLLSGNPVAGSGGSYVLTLSASNGVGDPATQTFTLSVADSPDLKATNVAVSPASIESGSHLTVSWNDQNAGVVDETKDFTDKVVVKRVVAGVATTVYSGLLSYSVSASGNIAAGQSTAQRHVAFDLPDGDPGVGNFVVTVTADFNNDVFENNASGHVSAESNNSATANFTSTLAAYPDLVVNNLVSPVDAWSGRTIAVSWTVTNQGPGTTSQTWVDRVSLENTTTGATVFLGDVTSPINLALGQSYTRTQQFVVPDGTSGNYRVVVAANPNANFFETDTQNNTAKGAAFPVHLTPYADLQVSSIAFPDTATAGQPLTVSWTVTNAGTGATNANAWTDTVALSSDPTFQHNVFTFGSAQNPSYLAPGESYAQSLTATVMVPLTGQYYVRVTTDVGNQQHEYLFENNNTRISESPTQVTVPPLKTAFLHVSSESVAGAAATLFAGQAITVNWDIKNTGAGAATGSWNDALALSSTPNWDGTNGYFLGPQGGFLGSLDAGSSYHRQAVVTLPQGISGTWYLVVVPDALFTSGAPGRDQGSTPLQLQIPPSPDLVVQSIDAPVSASTGQSVNLTWTVGNAGFGPTGTVSWQDAVYLSSSPTLQTTGSGAATLLGIYTHNGILDAVDTYTTTQSIVIPPTPGSGTYYLFVVADSENDVFEHVDGADAEANNALPRAVAIQFVPPPPSAQLAVTAVTVPPVVSSGQTMTVTWTVQNQGAGTTSASNWSDRLFLSQDADPSTVDDNTLLSTVSHSGALIPGAAYSGLASVTLPIGISGPYHLFLIVDSSSQVAEDDGESFILASAVTSVSLTPPPRLQVSTITTGDAFTGAPLALQWTVTNAGPGATPPSQASWVDKVYVADADATDPTTGLLLGSFVHNGALDADGFYSQSQNVLLPVDLPPGPHTLFVVTDADQNVFELNRGTSNIAPHAFDVALTPPPDLAITSIAAATSVYSGQPFTVSWQVANQGTGPTVKDQWNDAVYLSTDQFLDTTRAIYLGSVEHTGALVVGANYSATLTGTIPESASGPYYVFVVTDTGSAVFENGVRANNQSFAPQATLVSFVPASDLVVSSITVPASGIAGQAPATPISWTVVNQGVNPAVGTWSDAVYLSPTPTWDISDPLVARVVHTGDVAAGDSYTGSTTAFLPGGVPGNYYVIVRTDILNNVRESDDTNNLSASAATMALDVPVLQSGQTATGTIEAGQNLYYRFDTKAGQDVLLTANFAVPAQAQFYLRYGAPPTRSTYDAVYATASDLQQQLTLSATRTGTYYILLTGGGAAAGGQDFSLSVQLLQFGITSVTPGSVGTSGQATLTIAGSMFSLNSQVNLLTGDGRLLPALQVWWISSTELKATFNLAGLTLGNYTVEVSDRGQVAAQEAAITTTDAAPGHLTVRISGPSTRRIGQPVTVSVEYTNDGGSDLVAPLLELTPVFPNPAALHGGGIAPAKALSAPISGVAAGDFTPPPFIFGTPVIFLAGPSRGGGTLAPGDSGVFSYTFTALEGTFDIRLTSVGGQPVGSTTPLAIDWGAIKSEVQPSTISDSAWNAIWANFESIVGTSLSQFQSVVANNSNYLQQLGDPSPTLNDIISFLITQANDAFPTPFLASAVDLSLPAPGIPLDFGRAFLQPISGRYALGPLGRGWTDPWDESITVDPHGNATVLAGGAARQFALQPTTGNYTAAPGDHGVLTLTQGRYTLTESDGTVEQFRTDKRLDYIQDLAGNRVTAVYIGGLLFQLVHSNGESLSFSYNKAGRIAQVIDSSGQTAIYTYDAANEHLLSVTTPQGTTAYSYVTGQSAASEHALASMTYPDGTHTYFTYDERGRLAGQSRDGGAEPVTFSYDPVAGVNVTDATGAVTRLLFDPSGNVGIFADALGNDTRLQYDATNNLTQIIQANGAQYSYKYDTNGNLLRSIDPLGNETDLTYTASHNQLASLRDAKGNTTSYAYDSQGNLKLMVNADGTTTGATYNDLGQPTSTTDARGQAISYEYNTAGQVTLATFADGTEESFDYDSVGNLLSTTDATGTTTYTYNTTNEITSVTYPSSQKLLYSYDTGGRRSQIVDATSGFTVNYNYDTVGRLQSLTDFDGATLVTYHYDAVGRLSEQDNANGTYSTYAYDAASDLLHLVNYGPGAVVQSHFDYTYDAVNQRTSEGTIDGDWNYTYDATGQLTHAVFASTNPAIASQDLTYVYDAAGNRIKTIENGVTTIYTTNNRNEYTTVGGTTYQYDADGNMISQTDASGTTTFTYNSLNQLSKIVTPTDAWEYQYNALGERVAAIHNGETITYVLDPIGLGNVISAYDGSGHLVTDYAYGLGLVSQTGQLGTSYYQFDAIGSTAAMTAASGAPLFQYEYSPFGQPINATQSTDNPFQFAGLFGIGTDRSNGLVFMRARQYDASIGRFTAPDPLGITSGQSNLYSYANNSPMTFVDPAGLKYYDFGLSAAAFDYGVTGGIQAGAGGISIYWGFGTATTGIGGSLTRGLRTVNANGKYVQIQGAVGPLV